MRLTDIERLFPIGTSVMIVSDPAMKTYPKNVLGKVGAVTDVAGAFVVVDFGNRTDSFIYHEDLQRAPS